MKQVVPDIFEISKNRYTSVLRPFFPFIDRVVCLLFVVFDFEGGLNLFIENLDDWLKPRRWEELISGNFMEISLQYLFLLLICSNFLIFTGPVLYFICI